MIDGDGEDVGEPCETGVWNGATHPSCYPFAEKGHDGVTVRGGAIREFGIGLFFNHTERNAVQDLRVSDSYLGGIRLDRSRNAVVKNNQLFRNDQGVVLAGSTQSVVTDNHAWENHRGFFIEEVEDSRIARNLATNNSSGIRVLGGQRNQLSRNRTENNLDDGIMLHEGASDHLISMNQVTGNGLVGIIVYDPNNRVVGNHVSANGLGMPPHFPSGGIVVSTAQTRIEGNLLNGNSTGITIWEGTENLVTRNRILDNGKGIVVEDGGNRIENNRVSANHEGGILLTVVDHSKSGENQVEANLVVRNGGDGIFVAHTGAAGGLLSGNVANRNLDDGIDVEDEQTELAGNKASRNGDLGVEAVPGVTDGGRNRASRNGNPAQCLNVTCR